MPHALGPLVVQRNREPYDIRALANELEAPDTPSLGVFRWRIAELDGEIANRRVQQRALLGLQRNPLYAGTYVDQIEVGEIRVTTDGSRLFIDIPAFEEEAIPYDRELKPVSVDNSSLTTAVETRHLTFLADSDGVYRHLRSRPYLAVRVSP